MKHIRMLKKVLNDFVRKYLLDKIHSKSLSAFKWPEKEVITNEELEVCGITKNLIFHLARHTFATTITFATVSKMLGHSRIATTQLYARLSRRN